MARNDGYVEVYSGAGELLRIWRQKRGRSQLDVSLDTGVSQRHISFVESGRSVPSRELLLRLADALQVPLREQNVLLQAAGYAMMRAESAWGGAEMAPVRRAVERMLAKHEPYPALVLDRWWNVVQTNEAAPQFFGSFLSLAARPRPRNLLDLMFDPAGMRPFIEDWDRVAMGLLQRVHREAVGRVLDNRTLDLLRELERYPGIRALRAAPGPVGGAPGPVLPVTFVKDGQRSAWFSVVSVVGLPQDVAAQEFRVESMFPADGAGAQLG